MKPQTALKMLRYNLQLQPTEDITIPTLSSHKPIKESQSKQPSTNLLPISIVCVVKSLDDMNDTSLQEIRKFCQDKFLMFETRMYDSDRFRHDRDEIERLPAFHIYVKKIHRKTFYPNTRPYQIIIQAIEAHEESVKAKQRKKQNMRSFFINLKKKFVSLFHRKTRLEKSEWG